MTFFGHIFANIIIVDDPPIPICSVIKLAIYTSNSSNRELYDKASCRSLALSVVDSKYHFEVARRLDGIYRRLGPHSVFGPKVCAADVQTSAVRLYQHLPHLYRMHQSLNYARLLGTWCYAHSRFPNV
jgi:hypothetical protein